jgi:hypothetical protein
MVFSSKMRSAAHRVSLVGSLSLESMYRARLLGLVLIELRFLLECAITRDVQLRCYPSRLAPLWKRECGDTNAPGLLAGEGEGE